MADLVGPDMSTLDISDVSIPAAAAAPAAVEQAVAAPPPAANDAAPTAATTAAEQGDDASAAPGATSAFAVGEDVDYRDTGGDVIMVRVIAVHTDTVPAHYTISYANGQYRDTEESRLSRRAPGDDPWAYSKTAYSQQLKSNNSYYYWHGDAERRRQTGEQPVPLPLPKKLASSEAVREKKLRSIDHFTFADDGNIVKVYVELAGPLVNVSSSDVEAEYTDRSLLVSMMTPDAIYRFHVDRLMYPVDPLRCKAIITKGRKLLIKLHKGGPHQAWSKLRAVN